MSIRSLELLGRLANESGQPLNDVVAAYPFLLSRFLTDRLTSGTYSTRAARQFLPDVRELLDVDGWRADPCNESHFKPHGSIIQKYHNRAAIIITHNCLVYCRFCFRKDFVGFAQNTIQDPELTAALDYLRAHPENRDVLVTGGDPLALPNSRLIPFLEELSAIEHIKVVRIHSRALSAAPERIDEELLRFFQSRDRFWFYAHMNHPDDVKHPAVLTAARRLLAAGVPVLNQSVLLGGVNDEPSIIQELMLACYESRIMPYNLYVLDKVKGASHFSVSPRTINDIYRAIGDLPGPAQPALVLVDQHNTKRRILYDASIDLLQFLDSIDKAATPSCHESNEVL